MTTDVKIVPTPVDVETLEKKLLERDMLEKYMMEGIRKVRRITINELVPESSEDEGSKMVHTNSGAIRRRTAQKQEMIEEYVSEIESILRRVKELDYD